MNRSAPNTLALCVVLGLLAAPPAPAVAADCAERMAADPSAWRVLPPGTEGRLRRAATALAPQWHFDGVSVVCDRAKVTLCAEPGAGCHEVTLGDPSVRCEGEEAGGWCVGPGLASEALRSSLAGQVSGVRWVELRARPVASASPEPGDGLPWSALAVALSWLLLPLLLAWPVARLLGDRPRHLVVLGLLVILGLPLLLGARLGVWDTLLPGLLFAAGLLLARQPGRVLLLVFGATLFAVLLGEVAARVALDAPAAVPRPERARLGLQPEDWDPPCMSLYPETYGSADTRLADWQDASRRVLHVGDSLVFGGEVAAGETFVGRLDAAPDAVRHLNLGVPDTGADHHLLALRAWLPRLKPHAVVLYVYAGNDLQDIGRRYACCDLGPLLSFEAAGLPSRCEEPDWRLTPRGLLARSPAPYPLRVGATWSALAAHMVHLLPQLTHSLDRDDRPAHGLAVPPDALTKHRALMDAVAAELRAVSVPGVVVGLPYRRAVEGEHDDEAHAWLRGMLANAAAAGLHVVDASPAFSERPPGFWAGGAAWNEHLGPVGHAQMATFLERALPE